jgi:hypothetical protein
MKMRKNHLLTLFMCLVASMSYAQSMSVDEIIGLRKKNLSVFETYLKSKGWTATGTGMLSIRDTEDPNVTKNKVFYNNLDTYIEHSISRNSKSNRITIQVSDKDIYSKYAARMLALKYRLIKSELVNGDIVKVYQGKNDLIKLTTLIKREENSYISKTYYNFLILSTEDYVLNY